MEHKIALHRLLYINFIGHIHDNVYLSYKCKMKVFVVILITLLLKKIKRKKKLKRIRLNLIYKYFII